MEDSLKKIKPLKKALILPTDRGEHESRMEPLALTSKHHEDLVDLVLELVSESASFSSSIPPAFAQGTNRRTKATA